MNTDNAFAEFVRLPRGTYRATIDGCEIDLWLAVDRDLKVRGYTYTIFDTINRCYTANGFIPTTNLDLACERVLRVFETQP